MKKYFKNISVFFVTFGFILVISIFAFPKPAQADYCQGPDGQPVGGVTSSENCEALNNGSVWAIGNTPSLTSKIETGNNVNDSGWWGRNVIHPAVAWIVNVILRFVSLITGLGAVILNGVIFYTVVQVSENYAKLTVINEAWKVVRDVANMGFIFVLLYAAIQTILGMGKDNKQLIVRIIIVAILINFSLFFTKVIIDASNVLALFFYEGIVGPGVTQAGFTGAGSKGLSDQFMNQLNLQGLYNGKVGIDEIITIGVMGTIMLLIAAFIFFAVAILFIVRYVVLIMVLILSPIVFVAYILPSGTGMDKYKNDWREALVGQAFFAPIYFLLTWITIKILGGITSTKIFKASGTISDVSSLGVNNAGVVTGVDAGFFGTFINFAVVIIFLIVSLITAKSWAAKAGPQVGNLTKWAMGAAGGVTMGMAGRLGRNTVGAAAARLGQSEGFQRWAGRSVFGQMAYKGAGKAAKSTFDARATSTYGQIAKATETDFGQASAKGQGGFEAKIQRKTEAREKFAQTLSNRVQTNPVTGATTPSAKEQYAERISGRSRLKFLTRGGTQSSWNTIYGALGRHDRVAASKILNAQLAPLETQVQNLSNREAQLNQQLTNMSNELTTINAAVAASPTGTPTPQQTARLTALTGAPTDRNSIAYIANELATTQTRLTNAQTEVRRIEAIITSNRLTNPANQIVDPVKGTSRASRADEQNY